MYTEVVIVDRKGVLRNWKAVGLNAQGQKEAYL